VTVRRGTASPSGLSADEFAAKVREAMAYSGPPRGRRVPGAARDRG